MKTLKLAFLLTIAVVAFAPATQTKAQNVSVNFSLFQQELSPYGRWMTNPRFGEVWVYNDPSFRPYYSDGHWEYTNYGWSWVSDFDWGWAPFHYGRWEYDAYDGWMWIPGYDWGAAWVSWSSYDDYYGWAPLGYGVNINVSFGSIAYDRWTFIPRRNICDRDINRYYVSPDRNRGFRNAVVINNYYEGNGGRDRFTRGPERREVERYTRNTIPERRIDDRERQGRWANNNRRNDQNTGNSNGGRQNDQPGNINNNGRRNNGSPERRDDVNNGRRQNDNPVADNRRNDQQNNFPQRDQQRQQQEQQRGQQNNFPQRDQRQQQEQQRQEQQRQWQQQRQQQEQQRQQQQDQQRQRQQRDQQNNFPQRDQQRQQQDQQRQWQQQRQQQEQQRQQVERPMRQQQQGGGMERRAERRDNPGNGQPQNGNGNGRGKRGN
jgi:hypothetical protein